MEISFAAAELIFAAAWLAVRIAVWISQGKIVWKREAALLLMFVNLAVIIRFVFFPLRASGGKIPPLVLNPERMLPPRVNLVPLAHIADYEIKCETPG